MFKFSAIFALFFILGIVTSCSSNLNSSTDKIVSLMESSIRKLKTIDTSNLNTSDRQGIGDMILGLEDEMLPVVRRMSNSESKTVMEVFRKFDTDCEKYEYRVIGRLDALSLTIEYTSLMLEIVFS